VYLLENFISIYQYIIVIFFRVAIHIYRMLSTLQNVISLYVLVFGNYQFYYANNNTQLHNERCCQIISFYEKFIFDEINYLYNRR